MKLLIHDLEEEELKELLPSTPDNVIVVSKGSAIHSCIGCFGCWVKTPGACVIRDKYGDMGEMLAKCSEVIMISRCYYGGYSPFVKNVLDRSISYIHPYFAFRNREMHHRRRYDNHIDLRVCFYGENITENEKRTAEKLIHANAINLDCSVGQLVFVRNTEEIKGFIA